MSRVRVAMCLAVALPVVCGAAAYAAPGGAPHTRASNPPGAPAVILTCTNNALTGYLQNPYPLIGDPLAYTQHDAAITVQTAGCGLGTTLQCESNYYNGLLGNPNNVLGNPLGYSAYDAGQTLSLGFCAAF